MFPSYYVKNQKNKKQKQALRYKYKGLFKKCIFAFLSPHDLWSTGGSYMKYSWLKETFKHS